MILLNILEEVHHTNVTRTVPSLLHSMHEVIELDTDRKVGFPIRAELGRRTGRVTVPSVWIGESKSNSRSAADNV
jgi:hypothetical protein